MQMHEGGPACRRPPIRRVGAEETATDVRGAQHARPSVLALTTSKDSQGEPPGEPFGMKGERAVPVSTPAICGPGSSVQMVPIPTPCASPLGPAGRQGVNCAGHAVAEAEKHVGLHLRISGVIPEVARFRRLFLQVV